MELALKWVYYQGLNVIFLFSVFTRFATGKVRFCVLTQLDVPRVSLPAAKYNMAA